MTQQNSNAMKDLRCLKNGGFALATALTITLLLVGCNDQGNSKDKHDHGTKSAAVAGHPDGHGDEGEKLTHFNDQSELFLEFPPLVVGQAVRFAAHLTSLVDFKPLAEGRLTVVLSGGNAPEERFVAEAPATLGIFKPEVTPQVAGERTMTLLVESRLGLLAHKLGPVTVFPDAKAAEAGHDEQAHADAGIPFTKEQQWKIDFALAEAVRGLARTSISVTATIKAQPDGEAQLVAPVAGVLRAASPFPRVGQVVKKGQVLAMLTPRQGADVDQATLESSAGKARITLELARSERERMEALFKDEAIPEKRLFEARANEKLAKAELNAAQSRAGQASGTGGGIAIRAPINGTIADVSVTSGAFVAEGAPLIHIANTARLWLEARVPESEIGRLGVPTGASFSVDGYERMFAIDSGKNGRLIAVGGVVDAMTRTVPAIFEFNNPDNALRLGMTVKAQLFAGQAKEAVMVPASAVQDESGTQAVYVQIGGESFERRLVRTGIRDGEQIEIVAGLEAGQRIVSKGAYLIRLSTSKTGPSGHGH